MNQLYIKRSKRRITAAVCVILALLQFLLLFGCGKPDYPKEDLSLVRTEAKLSFMALWKESQTAEGSPGYGLVFDRYPSSPGLASIASVGFLLGCLPGAVEEGWITRAEAFARAEGTLNTVLAMEHFSGFYYHFVSMYTAKRSGSSEVSVIDTALLVSGALTAGEYFGGAVKEKAHEIYERINWNFYTGINNGAKQFRMGYWPEKGFEGWWDWAGEQLIMYVLGAGAPNPEYRIAKEMFYNFNRPEGSYKGGPKFIYSWNGSIFVHQFSHAFVDFRGLKDEQGADWFDNSVKASQNARNFIIDNSDRYASYGENSWGLSACDTPSGYSGYLGALPSGSNNIVNMSEGTIAPYGALASIVFTPKESIAALKYYYSLEKMQTSAYGLKGAYNIKNDGTEWYAPDILGIDKGITAIMMLNFLCDGITWKYFMQNTYIENAMDYLGFVKS